MNKKIVFLAALLILSGLVVMSYLASSGKDFYTIFGDDLSSAGAVLYQSHCAKCHGSQGEGVAAYPAIRNSKRSRQDLKNLIVHGSNEMPAFQKFNESELNQLIEYILEL
jgi:mono/diheme cytochrome c family protein